jgi:hypothetical protein
LSLGKGFSFATIIRLHFCLIYSFLALNKLTHKLF